MMLSESKYPRVLRQPRDKRGERRSRSRAAPVPRREREDRASAAATSHVAVAARRVMDLTSENLLL